MLQVIHDAFAHRRHVDPPPAALSDTVEDIEQALREGHGVCAVVDTEIVACVLVDIHGPVATLRRVSVVPGAAGGGLARALAEAAGDLAATLGARRVELLTRREFPELLAWWERHGFDVVREDADGFILGRDLPVILEVPTAEAMQALGGRLAGVLRAGDVLVVDGELGAGKTTLAKGLGAGLGIAGPVISPTFVISRVHRSLTDGPHLVHVDAYRLGDAAELSDIDLDASLEESVTYIEWGQGKAEWLAEDRLEVEIWRSTDPAADGRTVRLTGIGRRWAGALETMREQP
ncbi:tRNA (adenosine(37)-N6)-threonylcarbamoyltransferase complex ATPase subunit type 1 TsaE [Tessaracoccus antarcticus]|uniref:tRNA threonylcarbamoyladenosine biosynthesis protein TsaE n=2 Tax=Tessaracoccus antarcticus TaxID=2479848 RepID=A0A3M0G2U5_9ACTN|nr:tRNA (adenosine(37)-N6)-threonylcarbamoyltransferase complex ATPase subunit type 1 TsaE [Tessaracoccus antarcticus]